LLITNGVLFYFVETPRVYYSYVLSLLLW